MYKSCFQSVQWKSNLLNCDIGLVGRVFVNGLGDRGSIPGRLIPKSQKMLFDSSLLNTQHYKVSIKDKVEQSRERSGATRTSRCSSKWKGILRVALNNGRSTFLTYTMIMICNTSNCLFCCLMAYQPSWVI